MHGRRPTHVLSFTNRAYRRIDRFLDLFEWAIKRGALAQRHLPQRHRAMKWVDRWLALDNSVKGRETLVRTVEDAIYEALKEHDGTPVSYQ